ncbi:PLATZ domain-containing protein [Cucumis melo var. makuwa]|uniref:PLATZ domain-containing protein n=1 Tax=Cucumis melo var. makuwa TaxID=1194695 RepID=A0A5D3CS03_CUCMM|nr:PLATZ domain-containing protein [Cucumis melo var. makuwa]TYK14663.1 PLATZ domain-containing protein [Cucumis melo var. makuwa]
MIWQISLIHKQSSNELNWHCLISHCVHRRLQICKYVYQYVVRVPDLQDHLDCCNIQTYKINGEKAVHLCPRPQSKDSKPSTKLKFGGTCEACGRYIQDLPNRFCSIACKVSMVPMELNNQCCRFIDSESNLKDIPWKENHNLEINTSEMESSSISVAESTEEIKAWRVKTILNPKKLLHKRKGIPHRSPLK